MASTDMKLKVDPRVLTAKAGEIETEGGKMSGFLEKIKTDVFSLAQLWISDASDEYQNRFKSLYSDNEKILNLVKSHASNLKEVSEIYTTVETDVKNKQKPCKLMEYLNNFRCLYITNLKKLQNINITTVNNRSPEFIEKLPSNIR